MKEQALKEIQEVLSSFTLADKIEILANVFLVEGLSYMEEPTITADNLLDIITEHKRKNGETIENALATQGLVLLAWLDKE